MKKNVLSAIVASSFLMSSHLLSGNALANFSGVQAGAAVTTGPSSSSYSMSSASQNPAMNSFLISNDESFRMGYFPSAAFVTELGPVDNFAEDLESLADIIDDPSSATEDASEILDRFNQVLESAGENGFLNISGAAQLPLMPLYYYSESLQGTFGFDVAVSGIAGISVLDDDLLFDSQNFKFTTASAIYLKSGVEQRLSVSYSQAAYKSDWGNIYLGVKASYLRMSLSKQVLPILQLADTDLGELVTDEYDRYQETSGDFSLDVGLVFDAESYRVGLSFQNINSPEFNYGEVGRNCEQIVENTNARSNCEAARYFSDVKGEIAANEIHIKDPQARIDGLVKISDNLLLSAAADLNEYNDAIAFKHQWVHAGIDYQTDWFVLPSLRIGYHKNLVGTETSSISAGFSLFSILSFDAEYGLEEVVIDGSSAPRRLGFSLSIQEQF